MSGPVLLVPYESGWPAAFLRLRAELAAVFGPRALAIEHIGSTAVPGLAGQLRSIPTSGAITWSFATLCAATQGLPPTTVR